MEIRTEVKFSYRKRKKGREEERRGKKEGRKGGEREKGRKTSKLKFLLL